MQACARGKGATDSSSWMSRADCPSRSSPGKPAPLLHLLGLGRNAPFMEMREAPHTSILEVYNHLHIGQMRHHGPDLLAVDLDSASARVASPCRAAGACGSSKNSGLRADVTNRWSRL